MLKISSVVLLPAPKPACSSVMIFSTCGFDLFSMIFSMTVWMADETDCLVGLALLQVVFFFLRKCDDHKTRSIGFVMSAVITASPPVWTS